MARIVNARQYMVLGFSVVRQLLLGPDHSRSPKRRAMIEASLGLARSELTDEEAIDRLRGEWNEDAIVKESLERLRRQRDNYVGDRAFRLLEAAGRGSIVQPPPADLQKLFEEERELGRISLRDAFDRLTRAVPALDDLRRSVRDPGANTRSAPFSFRAAELVGPDSSSQDELARSRLALLVSLAYLTTVSGDRQRGDDSMPYFVVCERPAIIEVGRVSRD
jgi:hypothetical protein